METTSESTPGAMNEIPSTKLGIHKMGKRLIGDALVVIPDIELEREAWHEFRRTRITGSEICTACGMNQFETPLQLWARKTGRLDSKVESDQMWLGTKMQPVIMELFGKKSGYNVRDCNELWQSNTYPWAVASPDLIWWDDQEEGIGEVKTSGLWARGAWSSESCPEAANMQVQWAMGLTGGKVNQAHVIGLLAGNTQNFYWPKTQFDYEVFSYMLELGERFLHLIKTDTPPEAEAGDTKLVEKLLKVSEGAQKELPAEAAALLGAFDDLYEQHRAASKAEATLKDSLEAVKNEIKMKAGEMGSFVAGNRVVTIKERSRNGYEVKPASWVELKVKTVDGE